jgi:hypothetical protein
MLLPGLAFRRPRIEGNSFRLLARLFRRLSLLFRVAVGFSHGLILPVFSLSVFLLSVFV